MFSKIFFLKAFQGTPKQSEEVDAIDLVLVYLFTNCSLT